MLKKQLPSMVFVLILVRVLHCTVNLFIDINYSNLIFIAHVSPAAYIYPVVALSHVGLSSLKAVIVNNTGSGYFMMVLYEVFHQCDEECI
jgi:hypothetical protein